MGATMVGLSGVLPFVIIPQIAHNHEELMKTSIFKCMVAFAAGSLLGDVFIHLLPETYTALVLADCKNTIPIGLWVLAGLLTFMFIEKFFPDEDDDDKENGEDSATDKKTDDVVKLEHQKSFFHSIKTIGWLNLLANIFDNFTHGIAVAGSFQASTKFGFMTLFATLLHEVPHEIGDFAILLKSGLDYQKAAMAQVVTASAGILGAIVALYYSTAVEAGDATSWILPFTSGGFLYISLVGIVPDILKEKNFLVSVKQFMSLVFGIVIIYVLAAFFE